MAAAFNDTATLAILLKDTRVDPTANNNLVLKMVTYHSNKDAVAVLLTSGALDRIYSQMKKN
jgi:hypothetical protein